MNWKCRIGIHDWTLYDNELCYYSVCARCDKFYHLVWKKE